MFEPGKLQHLISTDRATARKVEAAPFTLEHLAGWIAGNPADAVYCYGNSGRCLLAQYAEAQGKGYFPVCYRMTAGDTPEFFEYLAVQRPHTFGAALERTRAAIKARAAQ